ncbi:MAG: hypothetical protein ACI4AB_09100 [Acetatifactor sp.]
MLTKKRGIVMNDMNQGTWAENPGSVVENQVPNKVAEAAAVGIAEPASQTKKETEESKKLRENFGFFGPATFLYAVFYAFCMYKNSSGVTFPFFVAGGLLFLYFSLSKLGDYLKKRKRLLHDCHRTSGHLHLLYR